MLAMLCMFLTICSRPFIKLYCSPFLLLQDLQSCHCFLFTHFCFVSTVIHSVESLYT